MRNGCRPMLRRAQRCTRRRSACGIAERRGVAEPAAATWVLLRALTGDSRHWGAFLPAFERAVAPARVIALDLPGNGTRRSEASPASVEAMAEAARAEL